jgi:hypothetical protein
MNDKPTITKLEEHDLAVQLYNAFHDLKDAAKKIPVTYVLSAGMLRDLKAIAEDGLRECGQK